MGNLYLIGMPGCGKTTLGCQAAQVLGKIFVDLDQWLEQQTGQTVAEIFAAVGESGFRQQETAVLRQVVQETNLLVATGGGIILAQKNVAMMQKSGRVILLHRPLDLLLADTIAEHRPLLAGDREKQLQQLYAQRLERYRAAATDIVQNDGTPAQGLARLLAIL